MASSWLLLGFVAFVQLIVVRSGNVVPVLLWSGDAANELINPLHKTSRSEFEKVLADRVAKSQPPMMVFVKENFCVEEIKDHKESLQQLDKAGSLTYLPSVESAVTAFENLPSYNVTVEDDFESVAEGQLVEVPINDIKAMLDVYNVIRESSPNLVIALTGKSCSFSSSERIKRQATEAPKGTKADSDALVVGTDGKILLYADKGPVLKIAGKDYELNTLASSSVIKSEKNRTEVKMTFTDAELGSVNLIVEFNVTSGYVKLVDFTYGIEGKADKPVTLKSKSTIEFPTGNFSYHCTKSIVFSGKAVDNKTMSLSLTGLQVQLNTTAFGDAYDCVGFTTVPIWMGLFVTLLLGLIMIWGVSMIMDIRTMDRFDDPKGKTITVTAQE